GPARTDLANLVAPVQGTRPNGAAHAHAGAGAPARRGIRHPPFPSRLSAVFPVPAPIDPVRDDPSRPARPAGTAASVHCLRGRAGDLDFRLPTPPDPPGRVGADDPSRPPGKLADAELRQGRISRLSRPDRAGEA